MLEPRRLAARISRFIWRSNSVSRSDRWDIVSVASKTSKATRLEIVTEGILTRMLQHDPELSGIDLLIFDEFHERSLQADTALAFALESQGGITSGSDNSGDVSHARRVTVAATVAGSGVAQLSRTRVSHLLSLPAGNRQQPLVPQWGSVVLDAVQNETAVC